MTHLLCTAIGKITIAVIKINHKGFLMILRITIIGVSAESVGLLEMY